MASSGTGIRLRPRFCSPHRTVTACAHRSRRFSSQGPKTEEHEQRVAQDKARTNEGLQGKQSLYINIDVLRGHFGAAGLHQVAENGLHSPKIHLVAQGAPPATTGHHCGGMQALCDGTCGQTPMSSPHQQPEDVQSGFLGQGRQHRQRRVLFVEWCHCAAFPLTQSPTGTSWQPPG